MLNWLQKIYRKLPYNSTRPYTMAWYCSGSTNTELVENLFKGGLIKDKRVKEAMLGVRKLPNLPYITSFPPPPHPPINLPYTCPGIYEPRI